MGCAVSKSREEDDDVLVSICRERKRLMKSAVDRRYALAEAHLKYNQSLYGVGLAIRLFVARHSSPPSPFLITFPQSDPTILPNPMHLHHIQSNPTKPVTGNVEREPVDGSEEEERAICEHFYDEVVDPPLPMNENDFGWDFFNPFDGVVNGFGQSYDHDLRAVSESEAPNLVKNGAEDVKAVGDVNVSMRVIDTHTHTDESGRELLEALKEVEDHFVRAYESGLDVSKMLETNVNVGLPHSGLDEIKENSDKLLQLTWHKSTLSRSPSCRSLLSSSSKSSSTWTGIKSDPFDEYGGMESGSHSLTLGRLYAWEKKLYGEVKAGNEMKKIYDRKSAQLSKEDMRGDGCSSLDKIEDEVRDLYSRISVSIQISDSISERIQKLRDEELQPQLIELLRGQMRTWRIMLESHKTQSQTMFQVKSFTCPAFGKFNDSHHLATLQLEAEIQNWRTCFSGYVYAKKAYIEALNGWLSPDIEFYSQRGTYEMNRPPLSVICHDWLIFLENLPDKVVTYSMKRLAKDIRTLWAQQGIEQQQKRKVDGLEVELEKRVIAFQRAERKILELKPSDKKTEVNVRNRVDYLSEKKGLLDMFKNRVETEKSKHQDSMQETRRVILIGFQTGFSSVFDSLTEFSEACSKMYSDLVENAKTASVGNEARTLKLNPIVDTEYQKESQVL